MDIEITTTIPAPLETVWSDVSRLDTHVEWMADASRIDFPDGRRSGTGTRMEVETRVGPLRTTDVMEITEWEPEDAAQQIPLCSATPRSKRR